MNAKTCISGADSAPIHCQHRFPSLRFCWLPIYDSASGLCYKHSADQRELRDSGDLSSALPLDLGRLKYAKPINEFLARLLLLLAQDKVSPRRAAVMAYTCNLLLRTLPAIDRDNELKLVPPAPKPETEPEGPPPSPTIIQ